jgi:hypothetical protein
VALRRCRSLTLRLALREVRRIDLDGRTLLLDVGASARQWRLEAPVDEATRLAVVSRAHALGIPVRRLVQVTPSTAEFQLVEP